MLAVVIQEHGGIFMSVKPSDSPRALPKTGWSRGEDGETAVGFLLVFTLGMGKVVGYGQLR